MTIITVMEPDDTVDFQVVFYTYNLKTCIYHFVDNKLAICTFYRCYLCESIVLLLYCFCRYFAISTQ